MVSCDPGQRPPSGPAAGIERGTGVERFPPTGGREPEGLRHDPVAGARGGPRLRRTEEAPMSLDASFRSNAWPTLGVELELQLVDARTMSQRSAIADVLAGVPGPLRDSVKPEFMQCYVEVNTGVCRSV